MFMCYVIALTVLKHQHTYLLSLSTEFELQEMNGFNGICGRKKMCSCDIDFYLLLSWMLLWRQVYEELCTSSHALSVEKLIATFIEAKSTGTEKPGKLVCTDGILCFIVVYRKQRLNSLEMNSDLLFQKCINFMQRHWTFEGLFSFAHIVKFLHFHIKMSSA